MKDVHKLVVLHTCGLVEKMTGKECYAAEPCVKCNARRDEHPVGEHEFVQAVVP